MSGKYSYSPTLSKHIYVSTSKNGLIPTSKNGERVCRKRFLSFSFEKSEKQNLTHMEYFFKKHVNLGRGSGKKLSLLKLELPMCINEKL